MGVNADNIEAVLNVWSNEQVEELSKTIAGKKMPINDIAKLIADSGNKINEPWYIYCNWEGIRSEYTEQR